MKRLALSSLVGVAVALLFSSCGGEGAIGGEVGDPQQAEEAVFNGDPANDAYYGLDMSFWEGPLSQYEMDCFWDNGVRHMVIGTQVEQITREQLEMARKRGMSLDAYVYLYWDEDMRAQVREAFRRVSGFTIGRMWLDVEEAPARGTSAAVLSMLLQEAVEECFLQGSADCGIYTARWFWDDWMDGTTAFSGIPLWYARYDDRPLLSSWSTDRFGGWAAPAAKQWAARVFCGVTSDHNTIQRMRGPDLVVDRTPPPSPTAVPPAPTDLWPVSYQKWIANVSSLQYMKLMVATVPGATSYQFKVESWNGSAWVTYATWSPAKPFQKFYPAWLNKLYRFQVRARNAYGYGPWSEWSAFEYNDYTGPRPADWGDVPPPPPPPPDADAGTPPPPSDAGLPPPPPPPDGGVDGPVGLTPDNNQAFSAGSAVTLGCTAVPSATSYAFAIEYLSGGAWKTYYTYQPTTSSQKFWPQIATSYRFRVQAKVGGVWGPYSSWATFVVR